uniref:Uncharacterized protein n=1 Tax=Aegilops tauschii subsp. strangulata TaxID=200361 RepID=A0A453LRR2_AEGTS
MAMRNATQQGSKKIVGVLYKGGEHAAQNPASWAAWRSAGHPRLARVAGPPVRRHRRQGRPRLRAGEAHRGRARARHHAVPPGVRGRGPDRPRQQPGAAPHGGDRLRPQRPAGAEVTGSNTVSVAEDQLMRILVLLRNFLPAHRQAVGGERDLAAVAHRAYDLEGKTAPAASGGCCSSASSPSAARCSTTTGSASTPRWRRSSARPSRRRSTPCCPSATSSCSTCRSPTRQGACSTRRRSPR